MRHLQDLFTRAKSFWPQRRVPVARVASNLAPRRSSYGGGNQFVQQLSRHLMFHGYEVCYRLDKDVDCILIMDGRESLTTFNVKEIAVLRYHHSSSVYKTPRQCEEDFQHSHLTYFATI